VFTVGQRRGLRIGTPTVDGRPRYVLDISPVTRTVTVGPRAALAVTTVEGVAARWFGAAPEVPVPCTAQVRAHGEAVQAVAESDRDGVVVRLHEPLLGVARGQAVVLYDGTRVLGSATITRTAA
jgi:tRNA-uridine 2-sulfurtransferase